MLSSKICPNCGIEKDTSLFHSHKKSSDGLYSICKECRKIRSAINYSLKKEKYREYEKRYREKNKHTKKYIERKQAYRERTKERNRRYDAEYRKKNQKALVSSKAAYRLRKNNDRDRLSKNIIDILMKSQRGKCACCGYKLNKDYHLDHIIPLSKGGKNIDSNVQLLKSKCNLKKGAKDPIEYMQSKGYLL